MVRAGKKIRRLAVLLISAMLSMLLTGCAAGATLNTALVLNDDLSGQRIMDVVLDDSSFSEYFSGSYDDLANVIAAGCPDGMAYTYSEDTGAKVYRFTIDFASPQDYQQKTSAILGRDTAVDISAPNSVWASGFRAREDFSTEDLLAWLKDAVVDQGFVDSSNAGYIFTTGTTSVSYGGQSYDASNYISVDLVSYLPLDRIEIATAASDIDTFDRTITYYVPTSSMSQKSDEIHAYLEGLCPSGATGTWITYDNGDAYEIAIAGQTAEGLQSFTQGALDSAQCAITVTKPADFSEAYTEEAQSSAASSAADSTAASAAAAGTASSAAASSAAAPAAAASTAAAAEGTGAAADTSRVFSFDRGWSEYLDMANFASNSYGTVQVDYTVSAAANMRVNADYAGYVQAAEPVTVASGSISQANVEMDLRKVYPVMSVNADVTAADERNIRQVVAVTVQGTPTQDEQAMIEARLAARAFITQDDGTEKQLITYKTSAGDDSFTVTLTEKATLGEAYAYSSGEHCLYQSAAVYSAKVKPLTLHYTDAVTASFSLMNCDLADEYLPGYQLSYTLHSGLFQKIQGGSDNLGSFTEALNPTLGVRTVSRGYYQLTTTDEEGYVQVTYCGTKLNLYAVGFYILMAAAAVCLLLWLKASGVFQAASRSAAAPVPAAVPAAQFCPNCGAPVEPGTAFCENCGARVDGAVPAMAGAAAAPMPAAVPDMFAPPAPLRASEPAASAAAPEVQISAPTELLPDLEQEAPLPVPTANTGRYCAYCGAPLKADDTFCGNCGNKC